MAGKDMREHSRGKRTEPEEVRSYRFADVLNEELDEVLNRRRRDDDDIDPKEQLKSANERAHRSRLLGLAFSGGGIRSATFNLGVLQALAEMKLLKLVHYLSTVSGGGYIGSWFRAWLHRTEVKKKDKQHGIRTKLDKVAHDLAPHRDTCAGDQPEAKQVRFLRKYSNYLTPKVGWFGADTWTALATYLRNLLLNLVLLIASFCAVLLVPHFARACVVELPEVAWIGYVALIGLVFSITFTALNVSYGGKSKPWYTSQLAIQMTVILPIFLACWLGGKAFSLIPTEVAYAEGLKWAGIGGLVIFGVLEILRITGRVKLEWETKWWGDGRVAAFLSGAIAGAALYGIRLLLDCPFMGLTELVVFFPPLFVCVLVLNNIFFVGLMSRSLPAELREWWARLNGWYLIYSIAWIGVFSIAYYLPDLAEEGFDKIAGIKFAAIAGWIGTTVAGLVAAKGASSGHDGAPPSFMRRLLAAVAPYVFILGIFVGLALVLDVALGESIHEEGLPDGWWIDLVKLAAIFGAIVFILSYKLDVNQCSMHTFYRNRLNRCYLGASNLKRAAHPFTGFDKTDDILLSELDDEDNHDQPYHIINATLNLVSGSELAWQTRKAASFVMSPKFCGYDISADAPSQRDTFCRTSEYAQTPYPLTIGTGVAISGAAASSNMGYHTSPAVAFLMTVFNVRLGWWIGNPAHVDGRKRSSPRNALLHLIAEMFGLTNRRGHYVYLSDGGHFENLGIYELVRRRCRYIIACDAEQDGNFEFTGLGNAIEKCRTDLGVDIDIKVDAIRDRDPETGYSQWHGAIGKIDYGADHAPGVLVYIKSSLTGDEPTDVLRYASKNPNFPHQSTADQWFNESQFESYRALGYHVATEIFGGITLKGTRDRQQREQLFVELAEKWWPPSIADAAAFTQHTRSLAIIYRTLRTDKNLAYLSAQIYPEWQVFMQVAESDKKKANTNRPRKLVPEAPESEAEARAGFYVCNSMIQLMEDVYLDLHLEDEYKHPDNRGWTNLFKHWSWSATFRLTWSISASTYGARFQKFCEKRLGLVLGTLRTDKTINLSSKTWEGTVSASHLNWHEKDLIGEFRKACEEEYKDPGTVYLLQMEPDKGVPPEHHDKLRTTFGFVVVRDRAILYLRIQDHLRRMGLAREAIAQLLKEGDVEKAGDPPDKFAKDEKFAERVAHFKQRFASVKMEVKGRD